MPTAPYNLEIIDSCLTCKARESFLFCNLPEATLKKLDAIKSVATYPQGAFLFMEEQPCRGVFILCQGRVKLYTSSSEGKDIILRIAHPGEVLGLSAAVYERPYLATAETAEPAQVNFFRREDFVKFLRENSEASFRAAQVLSFDYHAAYEMVRTLGIAHSTPEKFARLILRLAGGPKQREKKGESISVHVNFTHEEMASMIGTCRETVERLLSDFKRRQMIRYHGSTLTILDRAGLEKLLHY
jgi:CRP/FNR family cyclic AMP-dependent transcriptional regulator